MDVMERIWQCLLERAGPPVRISSTDDGFDVGLVRSWSAEKLRREADNLVKDYVGEEPPPAAVLRFVHHLLLQTFEDMKGILEPLLGSDKALGTRLRIPLARHPLSDPLSGGMCRICDRRTKQSGAAKPRTDFARDGETGRSRPRALPRIVLRCVKGVHRVPP